MDENVINSAMEEEMKKTEPSTDKELGKLAVEVWKIEKKIQKSKEKLSEEENKSFEFLFNRVNQILGNCNVKITDFSNQKWNDGMALLDIISVEEVEGLEFPVVGETISPLVEINGEVSQRSKVVIYKPIEKEDKEPETIEELVEHKKNKKNLWICLILLLVIIALIFGVTLFLRNCDNEGNTTANEQKPIENEIENVDGFVDVEIEDEIEKYACESGESSMDVNTDENQGSSQNVETSFEDNGDNIVNNMLEDIVESDGDNVNESIVENEQNVE